MKKKSLATLLRRTPVTIRVDLVRFLPENKAVIAMLADNNKTVYIGIVDLVGSKVRAELRKAWRNKSPSVRLYRDKDHLLPVCSL